MSDAPELDLQAAHRHFSAVCFNRAWDLIDQPQRTPAEDEEMLRLSLASHWHWSQREDCTTVSHSVGYWQTARIYALLNQPGNALRYANLCLAVSQGEDVPPFYLGYAYEALARAAAAAGDAALVQDALQSARQVSEQITDVEERQTLLNDLASIRV